MDLNRPLVPARPSWRTRLRRSAPYAVAATLLAVTLSGCIKLEMALDIASDDTIDGTVVFAVDKSLLTLGGGDPEEAFGDALTDAPFPTDGTGGGEVRTEVYDQDGKYGATYIFSDMPLEAFNDEDLSITREGDFFVVSGTINTGTGEEPGADPSASAEPLPTELLGGFDVSISMTFPGEVVEHTGTLEGTTVTWRPEGTEAVEISAKARATSDAGPLGLASSSSTALYGGIAVAVLLVGALLVLLLVRRRATPAAAGAPPEAAGYQGAADPGAGPVTGAVFAPDGSVVPASGPVPGFDPQPALILPDDQPTVVPDVVAPEPVAPQSWTPEPEAPPMWTPEASTPDAPVAPQVWTPEPPAAPEPPEGESPQGAPGPVPPA